MLPSARRAELSRQYFDNSYLSRKAFEGEGIPGAPPQQDLSLDPQHQLHAAGGKDGRKQSFVGKGVQPAGKGGGSIRSRTTAGLTTFEDDLDAGFGSVAGKPPPHGSSASHVGLSQQEQQGSSPFKDAADYDDSEFSDDDEDDTLGSMLSGESPSRSSAGAPDSAAGEIWRMLCSLDNLVLEVKANTCQCQRLGARLAALKKPMVAVHRGRQTADHAVLSTIKDLVAEAQHFMERFLDPEWWRHGAGRQEDSEMFRELTFRLGFLMQAPPGFQEQSQAEDHMDRLKDYEDLQAMLEEKLRVTNDEPRANEIMDVLKQVRTRAAAEGSGSSPEIDFDKLQFLRERSLGNGGFGTVLPATLHGALVAVKKLNNQNVGADLLQELRRDVQEFHTMQFDFVVKTLGACTVRPNLCIVQERAPTSLFDLLHKSDLSVTLPDNEKAAMLYDVARGLQYLHIKRIIHGNVKSSNILVFENNRLKVSDFGLIELRESQSGYGGDTVPSAAWTAPEVLDDQDPSVLSDVYSFGVLVHEVLTQRIPFSGKSVAKVITAVVAKGHRPAYMEGEEEACPPGLVKLAQTCWTQESMARPRGMSSIVTELGHIVNSLGGDPRPQPYTQTAGESASNTPVRGSAATAGMTEQERRIHELEQELRALKMKNGGGGGGGGGGGDGSVRGSGGDSRSRNLAHGQGQGARRGSGNSMAMPATHGGDAGAAVYNGVPEERKVLRMLYTATQGPGWFQNSGWETNDPNLSSWHGVVCDEGGHVTLLQLPSNNLQGQIPRELTGLSRLRTLILRDNFLEGPVPPEFGGFQRLQELDLSMNDFTGAIPASLSSAFSLERVCLQCNGFTGNVPRALLKLNNLKVFIVDWRELSDTHPFRKFRKASPPPTEAEIQRAMSDSRRAARDRAVLSARAAATRNLIGTGSGGGGSGGGGGGVQHQYPVPFYPGVGGGGAAGMNPGSGYVTPVGSTPARSGSITGAGAGTGGGRFKVMMRGTGSGVSRPQSPSFRGREDDLGLGAAPGAGAGAVAGGQRAALSRGDSGHWSNSNRSGQFDQASANGSSSQKHYPVPAPTAPYRGEDGIQGKARAKAESETSSATGAGKKWKNALALAGKAFKDAVAADLHPGYTVEKKQT